MWKKISDDNMSSNIAYEFKANPQFNLEKSKEDGWLLHNSYNNKNELFIENDLEIVKSKAFNHIVTRFFEDIIKTTTTTSKLLEVLDQTITNSLALGKSDVVIGSGSKTQSFALDTLSAVLKQQCLSLILETKIKNHLNEE